MVPESGGRPLRKKGETVTPVTSVQLEAPDNLLEALNGASIDEEHRTVMSVVIQKVQSTKSGLTEACARPSGAPSSAAGPLEATPRKRLSGFKLDRKPLEHAATNL